MQDQINIADIDAEFERSGRHQDLQLAGLEPLLGVEAAFFAERAMVAGDVLGAHAFAQPQRQAFSEFARVDEHQRGAVFADQRHHAFVVLAPDLM